MDTGPEQVRQQAGAAPAQADNPAVVADAEQHALAQFAALRGRGPSLNHAAVWLAAGAVAGAASALLVRRLLSGR